MKIKSKRVVHGGNMYKYDRQVVRHDVVVKYVTNKRFKRKENEPK